jgi:hypothetical protein
VFTAWGLQTQNVSASGFPVTRVQGGYISLHEAVRNLYAMPDTITVGGHRAHRTPAREHKTTVKSSPCPSLVCCTIHIRCRTHFGYFHCRHAAPLASIPALRQGVKPGARARLPVAAAERTHARRLSPQPLPALRAQARGAYVIAMTATMVLQPSHLSSITEGQQHCQQVNYAALRQNRPSAPSTFGDVPAIVVSAEQKFLKGEVSSLCRHS